MINIDELYRLVLDLANKNNGQYISPAEFNRYVKIANREYFDKLIGKNNVPQNFYGRDRTHDAKVRLFRQIADIDLIGGVGDLPAGWEKTNAVYTTGNPPIEVVQVDEDRLARRFSSPLDSPTLEYPMYVEDDTTIRVYPSTITQVTMRYLRSPVTPVWGYTVTGRKPVYDPATSTNLEWDENDMFEIANRVLQLVGVSMMNNNLVNYTEGKQNQE